MALLSAVVIPVAVALLDAVGIGIGLRLAGVPFVLPLTSLVFLGGFIPFVGVFVCCWARPCDCTRSPSSFLTDTSTDTPGSDTP